MEPGPFISITARGHNIHMSNAAVVTSFKTGFAGTFLDQVQTSCSLRCIHDSLNNLQ
ncbi:hypothetical protein Hanom_Chr11g01035021 [Helianthus anomalus]